MARKRRWFGMAWKRRCSNDATNGRCWECEEPTLFVNGEKGPRAEAARRLLSWRYDDEGFVTQRAMVPRTSHFRLAWLLTSRCLKTRTGRPEAPGYWLRRASVEAQYMSPIPPPPGIAGALSFSGFSTTTASVVSSSPAMEAAFCSAVRVTLVGSMTPAATRSS